VRRVDYGSSDHDGRRFRIETRQASAGGTGREITGGQPWIRATATKRCSAALVASTAAFLASHTSHISAACGSWPARKYVPSRPGAAHQRRSDHECRKSCGTDGPEPNCISRSPGGRIIREEHGTRKTSRINSSTLTTAHAA